MKRNLFFFSLIASAFYASQADAVCFDFETGDLQGWKVVSGEFGKIVCDREFEHHSKSVKYTKSGKYFLSTLESKDGGAIDSFTGVVESPLIGLNSPKITFKIGGGKNASFELIDRKTGEVYASATGFNTQRMVDRVWDVPKAIGRDVFFRVTDEGAGGWCHLTLDDIKFDGIIGKGDFAERAIEAKANEKNVYLSEGGKKILIVNGVRGQNYTKELYEALGKKFTVEQVYPDKAVEKIKKELYDLVFLYGSNNMSMFIPEICKASKKTRIGWIPAGGCKVWHIRRYGCRIVELNGVGRKKAASQLADVTRELLAVLPVTPAEIKSARDAIVELASQFKSYPGELFLKELNAISKLPADTQRAKLEELLVRALVKENPIVNANEIAFVVREQWASDHHNTATIFQHGEINEHSYKTQGSLKALDPKNLKTRVIVPEMKNRTVRNPEVDYDGNRIVFSMRNSKEDDYHIYSVNADGSSMKQLTSAKGVSDIDPVWLPDGDIVFSSTRNPKYCMCNRHIMANLYRMHGDGANIHQIGVSTLFEGHSAVLPDGRIIYDRWEYVDRNFGDAQGLWTCNPDGTRHSIYWGNNTTSPGGVINARALGNDSSKVIAVLGSCHDRPWGALGIIDRTKGVDGQEPVIRTWPAKFRDRIHAGGKEDFDSTGGVPLKYADPFAIDESHFIACRMYGRGSELALVYIDLHGNEVVFHKEYPGCHSPVVLRKTKKPVVQSEKRNFESPTAKGLFYVQNVYIGTHMQGVEKGSIKALRIVESPEKRNWTPRSGWFGHGEEAPGMNWHSFENKRILGTVPVEADGSAYFEVPANTFVYFQALDKDGKMVQSMRSGAYVQPGETFGCVGCHENRVNEAAPVTKLPLAMRRKASKLDGAYNLKGLEKGTKPHFYSYQKEVQPIFTKNCVSCHDYGKKAGEKVNFSGDLGAFFCTSYVDMWALGYVTCIGGGPAEIQQPYTWGSHASKLTKFLYGHGKVTLTDEERDRIITWMDINAPYYPQYESAYPDNPGGRNPLTFEECAKITELCGIKIKNGHSAKQREQLNFTRPEHSRILSGAPTGAARNEALEIIKKGAERLKVKPRCDMDGFVPCEKDIEREKRYQKCLEIERRNYDAIRAGKKNYDS